MSEEEGRPRPVASRRQVWRLTRHHLVPLAAMGIAAAESVAALCDRVMVSYVEVAKLRPKVEGQVMTSVWTESVRTWVGTLRNAPLRIHDPYSWVELIFHESVHLRMHRDRPWRPTTARAQYFQMQLPCPDLEQAIADRHAGNLELIAHPTSVGAPPVIRLHARSGSTELFEPIHRSPRGRQPAAALARAVRALAVRRRPTRPSRVADRPRHHRADGTGRDAGQRPGAGADLPALPTAGPAGRPRTKDRVTRISHFVGVSCPNVITSTPVYR